MIPYWRNDLTPEEKAQWEAEEPLRRKQREKQRKEWAEEQRLANIALDKLGAHDLFKQPIEVGDTIAWPTSAGRAVGITVGRITKITWKDKRNSVSGRMYTVQARPLKAGYSGHYSRKWDPVTKQYDDSAEIAPVTIQKVQNIVKVEVPAQQIGMEL